MKEQNAISEERINGFKSSIDQYTKSRDEIVCKKHGINTTLLEKWIKTQSNDP